VKVDGLFLSFQAASKKFPLREVRHEDRKGHTWGMRAKGSLRGDRILEQKVLKRRPQKRRSLQKEEAKAIEKIVSCPQQNHPSCRETAEKGAALLGGGLRVRKFIRKREGLNDTGVNEPKDQVRWKRHVSSQ